MRKVLACILPLLLIVFGIASTAFAENDNEGNWNIEGQDAEIQVHGTECSLKLNPGTIKIVKPGEHPVVVVGEGYWYFYVDGKLVGKGSENEFKFKDLTEGKHVLRVELHKVDGTPYVNGAFKERKINVLVPPPVVGGGGEQKAEWKIVLPASGSVVTTTQITIKLNLGTGVIPVGEWHFLIDSKEVGQSPNSEFTFKNLTPGPHVVRVERRTNNQPIAGAVQEVPINVVLPNTGANTAPIALGGVLLLGLGSYLWLRKENRAA